MRWPLHPGQGFGAVSSEAYAAGGVLSFLYFNALPQSDDLGLQLLLFRLVALAQHIEPLVTQPTAGVVLVNLDTLKTRDFQAFA